jgi:hypothetical protein
MSILVLLTSALAACGAELSLPSFTINGEIYTNVVVSAGSKGRLMVQHAAGVGAVPVADLDYELLKKLADAEVLSGRAVKDLLAKKAPKVRPKITQVVTNENGEVIVREIDATLQVRATMLARSARARLENEARALGFSPTDIEKSVSSLTTTALLAIAAGAVFFYILRCWCLFRICHRATGRGSVLVFAPLLRWFPLADAARMSRHWLVIPVFALAGLYLPPVLPQLPWVPLAYLSVVCTLWLITAILFIVWCFRICRELKHSALFGFLLVLPLLDWFALLYMAFGGQKAEGKFTLNGQPAAI